LDLNVSIEVFRLENMIKEKKNVSRIRKKTFYLQYIIGLLDNLSKKSRVYSEH
jgi:hypothetical protein